ncbi:relaxase/mobilization nuclease domain-containing protein [Endozoicomonas ascidiicola]|uniref:relaxase/mobilization nuclease domain-containing protein n=1 Tax=Endozoicomonas ascidiicola TaxID=1698521 RepID=UPI00082A7D2C|nr:relaxase/mobilization nuclease domain-containing protein [Endozoicomonas ascidiicola]
MIADFKRSGGKAEGIGLAIYMLDPSAKSNVRIKEHHDKKDDPERVLLIATDSALPVLKTMPAKKAAHYFMDSIETWNIQHRKGQKQPQNAWEQIAVSFSPQDQNKVTPQKAIDITREALQQVASGERPTLFVVHGDKNHLHVHVMYSTVNSEGRIHNLHEDFRLWELEMERLEIKYGLFRVYTRKACADDDMNRMPDGTNPTSTEHRLQTHTSEPSCKKRLRDIIDSCINSARQLPENKQFATFIKLLGKKGVGVSANLQSTDRVAGVRLYYGIFSQKGIKASRLGRAYAWSQLAKTVCFDTNNKYHLSLLKTADNRISQFITSLVTKEIDTAKIQTEPANTAAHTKNSSIKASGSSAAGGGGGGGSADIPDFYPDWLKKYVQSLLAEARNTEAQVASEQARAAETALEVASQMHLAYLQRLMPRVSRMKSEHPQKQPGHQ